MIDNAYIFSWSKKNNHLEPSIGEELCGILHVIKSQAADLREPQSFADSFWREVIHELMYLFDAAAEEEQYPETLVYSYLFPLKHIESRLRNALPFIDLKKVYSRPWHAHTSFTGYTMQTGVASYTADGGKDIRTSYESETIEAERKVLGLSPGENLQTVFVIPVVYKNSEQGGTKPTVGNISHFYGISSSS